MDRVGQLVRLPRKIKERLDSAARRRGVTIQAYIERAVEDRLDADDDRRQRQQDDRRTRRERDSDAPRGLGLSLRSLSAPEPTASPPIAETSPAPVVVNVGPQGTAGRESGPIGALVDFIVGGPAFNREQRKRTAVEILKAHGRTGEEREALAKQLDTALAARIKQEPNGLAGLRSVGGWFGR